MKKRILLLLLVSLNFVSMCFSQTIWNVDECMRYASEHNNKVVSQSTRLKDAKIDRMAALGRFLPKIYGDANVRYSFGRSVNPETNTYKDISTFNNNYSISGSLPLFRGGALINELKLAKANLLLNKASLQEEKDMAALETFKAFIEVLYYEGTTRMAQEKIQESDSLLYKVKRMYELGLKGEADVIEVAAQYSEDDYNVTAQNNLLEMSKIKLKQSMNYPLLDSLNVDDNLLQSFDIDDVLLEDTIISETDLLSNPLMVQADAVMACAKYQYASSWGGVMPAIDFNAGMYSSYFKELHKRYPSFGTQLGNNLGYYVGINIQIPFFSGFDRIKDIKKAKNNYKQAQEDYKYKLSELQKLVAEAVFDRRASLKESLLARERVRKDETTYRISQRKYEEGLVTSLELRAAASALMKSKAELLQKQLNFLLQCRLVEYYKGEPLIHSSIKTLE
ncbi:TolC family protein [Falsiporphyromonas endometrii]|uniref:TolC family protein n=1 Tax=Falsiporphyromonas endometrii TaxID=1387297 RepID=A0ABV9K7N0_9PORP